MLLRKLAHQGSFGFATREEPLLLFIVCGADWNFPRDGHPEGVHVGEILSEVLGGVAVCDSSCSSMTGRTPEGPGARSREAR